MRLVDLAGTRDTAQSSESDALLRRQCGVIRDLVEGDRGAELLRAVEEDFETIAEVLRAIWLTRAPSPKAVDLISGFGELWSARALAAYLASLGKSATWLDARKVLTIEAGETPAVDWDPDFLLAKFIIKFMAELNYRTFEIFPGNMSYYES